MKKIVSRFGAVAVVMAMALAVAGCSGIPRSGVVHQGEPVMQADVDVIEFLPASPFDDASQEQILRGFLDAASSPQDDFAIARQFLSTGFKSQWDASAEVVIDLGVRTFSTPQENTAALSAVTFADVDARGQYREVTPNAPLTLSYSFVLEEGQWRISAAPPGVLIDRFTFDQVFATHALYFFDSTFTKLVPDVRWFPTGSSTATRIVKALLAGPAPWLAEGGAVVTAFPQGTELVADAVPVSNRTASVDLTSQALDASRAGMMHMQTQARESLSSVDSVSEVALLVEGNVQNTTVPSNASPDLNERLDGRPAVIQGGKLGFVSGDTLVEISGLSELIEPLGATAVALSSSLNVAAVLTPAGVSVVRAPEGSSVLDTRQNLITPALDSSNYVWSVPQGAPMDILVYSLDGQVSSLIAPWGSASRIVSLNIARDGTRLIALLEDGGQVRFVAANIQRGERNRPLVIGTPIELAVDPGLPVDATWADAFTAVALVTSPDGASRMTSQIIGGNSESLPASTAIVSLAGANLITQLRIRASDNRLYVLRGSSYWQLLASDVSVLAALQ